MHNQLASRELKSCFTRLEQVDPQALVIRTAAFFGPWDRYNFAWAALSALAEGRRFAACPNSVVSPTFVPDLGHATLDLLVDGETGLWHLANRGSVSWHDFAMWLADAAGLDTSLIDAVPAAGERRASRAEATRTPAGRGQCGSEPGRASLPRSAGGGRLWTEQRRARAGDELGCAPPATRVSARSPAAGR